MKKMMLMLALPLLVASCTPNDSDIDSGDDQLVKANTIVVYECNERLFSRNNAFQKIREYLPVLQEMQVNVLWLMPIHPRGTVNSVGSPYCVKDYGAIEPAFGTKESLKQLVEDCHSRGMKVILDWVANHTAYDHQWYIDHPDWYTSPRGEEVNWQDVAPLDYTQTDVRQAMQDAMLYWIREVDIDGFRCDYAEGVPNAFWSDAIAAIKQEKASAIMLAEASDVSLYDAGFDWMYSWGYLEAVQGLFKGTRTPRGLINASAREFNSTPTGKERLRYVTTHDASSEQAPSSYYTNAKGELAASCLTFFIGGVPMIYSSQEVGDVSKLEFFNYHIKNFSAENSTTAAYIALMKAYNATAAARYGELTNLSTDEVAIISRKQGKREILVIVNTKATKQTITIPEEWQNVSCKDLLNNTSLKVPSTMELNSYDYYIYSR